MKLLERLKESPFRYAVPWSMNAARPVIGHEAFRQARRGNWGKAQQLFVTAWATDMEGFPARYLNASSKAGAVADPVADGLLRAQSFAALAPEIPVTASIVAGAELYNLKLNGRIQNGRDRPYVPREAKWGTLIQAAGVIWTSGGIKREKKLQKLGGQASMLAGTGLRVYGYWKERQHGLSKHEHKGHKKHYSNNQYRSRIDKNMLNTALFCFVRTVLLTCSMTRCPSAAKTAVPSVSTPYALLLCVCSRISATAALIWAMRSESPCPVSGWHSLLHQR